MLGFPVPVPKNGDDLDATPVGQDLTYLLQVLQAYDLSNVLAGSALDTLFAASNSPLQRFMDGFQSFIVSGGLSSGFTLLSYTVPAIIGATFQSNGVRVASISGQTFTAAINSDTYISCRSTGVINTPQAVANGAAAPALPTADSQWVEKVISNGTTITSIVDLRNLSPLPDSLGFSPISSNFLPGTTAETDVPGLAVTILATGTRPIKVTAKVGVYNSGGADQINVKIKEGSTVLQTAPISTPATNKVQTCQFTAYILAPTAGFHTYKVSMAGSVANPAMEATATETCFILAEAA